MNPCEHFQALLLDDLYGLLEPDEARALQQHVSQCWDCQAARARAEGQKKLLAAAAKAEFAHVRFEPPAAIALASTGGPAVRSIRPVRRTWTRWAAVAAVLLLGVGLGIPGREYYRQVEETADARARAGNAYAKQTSLETDARNRRDVAAHQLQAAQQELAQAQQLLQQERTKIRQTIAQRPLHIVVTGPASFEPGAPNSYQVAVRDTQHNPAFVRLSYSVLDQDDRVLFTQRDVEARGDYQIKLEPETLKNVKPDSKLTLQVEARGADGQQGQVSERLALVRAPYLTHLATDKPMYQPDETVRFRSLTLERHGFKPVQEPLRLVFTVSKPDGKEDVIGQGSARVAGDSGAPVSLDDKPIRGIGAGEYHLDPTAPGGEYTLTVKEEENRFMPQQRKFLVNRYQPPKLLKELEFTRKSYGPGDEVVAACKALTAGDKKPVAEKPVLAVVNVDGKTYGPDGREGGPVSLRTNAAGGVAVKFKLPAAMAKGDASLTVQFNDGANVETMVRPVPIVLKKLNVDFYPEGGDLVAGTPNRVYFQARTMLDKAAELKGRVVDGRGQAVAEAVTFNIPDQPGANQGMGAFTFTPQAGQSYELKIDSPTGIEGKFPLPEAKKDGVVLSVVYGVSADTEAIKLKIASPERDRDLLVGAYCRGRLMAQQNVRATPDQPAEAELRPATGAGGVCRVTVFEKIIQGDNQVRLQPRAERLVYRTPVERLRLTLRPDKPDYVPGEKATLKVEARDEKGKPAPAILMVAAVDKSVLKLADEKTFRTMPTHFLLTSEIRKPEDLEHADFLLGDHPGAKDALDLLLGTQGWRRFAEQTDPNEFRRTHPGDGERLMVMSGRLLPSSLSPRQNSLDWQALQKVEDRYHDKLGDLKDKIAGAEKLRNKAEKDTDTQDQIADAQKETAAARAELAREEQTLNDYEERTKSIVHATAPYAAIGLAAAGLLGLAVGLLRRTTPAAIPGFVLGACSLLVAGMIAVVFLFPVAAPKVVPWAGRQVASVPPMSGPAPAADMKHMEAMPAEPKGEAKGDGKGLGGFNGAPGQAPAGMAGPGNDPRDFALPMNRNGVAPPPAPHPMVDEKVAPAMPKRQAAPERFARPGMPAQGARGGGAHKPQFPEVDKFKKDKLIRLEEELDLAKEHQGLPALKLEAAQQQRGLGPVPPPGAPMPMVPAMPQVDFGRAAIAQEELRMAAGAQPFDRKRRADALARSGAIGLDSLAVLEEGVPLRHADAEEPAPFVVRQYAHFRNPTEGDKVRSDFTETLYWNPVLVLPNGEGEVSFGLSDNVTTFEILAAGNTLDGRLGAVTIDLNSKLPLSVEPKVPIEVTAGDRIEMPLGIANTTDASREVTLTAQAVGLQLLDRPGDDKLQIAADGRTRRVYHFQPSIGEGDAEVTFQALSGPVKDTVVKRIQVVPAGFPVVGAQSDLLEKSARHDLVLPETWLKGTLKYQVAIYPSTLADLQKGLEALLREPNGCFEQTSTSNYPNLLILDYLKETDQGKPDVARHAKELLDRGYQRLVAFECVDPAKSNRRGYEWFGGTAPPHEALTAYGLMQFRDMARVYDVDKVMVERTRNYLMAARDGKGGFTRNPQALDTFGRAPEEITNAYIVWALTESGKEDDVTRELSTLHDKAKESKDPYFLALVGNSLMNRDRFADALGLLQKLAGLQQKDGHLDAAQTSITGSGGRDLQIETTALSLLAWLKAKRPDLFNAQVQSAAKWVGQQRGGYGGFGSTQSTILALKGLIAYARSNKKTAEPGDLVVSIGGKEIGRTHFAAGVEDAVVLEIPDAEKVLRPGKNPVDVQVTGKNEFPYTASWSYRTLKPVSDDKCPVAMTAKLDRQTANEGEAVRLTVTVENRTGKGQGMTVAVIGLPGGLTIPEDMKQLKDLARLRNNGTERGPIDFFEIRGRELVLYWRDLAPDAKDAKRLEVSLDLICRVPGQYKGPASRGYLYYNADHKCWVEPLQIAIQAKAGE